MLLPPLALALLDAIDEPSLLVERGRVVAANGEAKRLLGQGIVDRDVRLAIRHPEALDLILDNRVVEARVVELIGIGSADQSWRMILQPLSDTGLRLVRLTNQSDLRAAERMRVDFVANASHELRTPLATISGYAETLADDDDPLDDDTRKRFGATIRNEAGRMLRLIEQLMGLSRIEADRFRAPSDRVDPVDIVELAVEECGEFARRRRAVISVDADDDVPPVRGDANQLLQVVNNLIVNALRYGCTGDGCPIDIGIHRLSRDVIITVRDHGEGIATEHLPRVTERFYRVDPARSRDQGGTGLGLAIVKHIVERHRGHLDIRSAPGRGTEVAVRLPIA